MIQVFSRRWVHFSHKVVRHDSVSEAVQFLVEELSAGNCAEASVVQSIDLGDWWEPIHAVNPEMCVDVDEMNSAMRMWEAAIRGDDGAQEAWDAFKAQCDQ